MDQTLVFEYLMILIGLELFEVSWQKGDHFGQLITQLRSLYEKNIFLFFAYHPSFYFLLCLLIATGNTSIALYSAIGMKLADILFKISLLDKLTKGKSLDAYEVLIREDVAISPAFKYIGVILYPTLFWLAFG